LRAGRNPGLEKKLRRTEAADTFEAIARHWHARQLPRWTKTHASDVLESLERDVFPSVGRMPIRDITPPIVLPVLRQIERRPAIETARRVRQRMSAVFVYAIALGIGESDPAAIVKGAWRRW
jgi:integrase